MVGWPVQFSRVVWSSPLEFDRLPFGFPRPVWWQSLRRRPEDAGLANGLLRQVPPIDFTTLPRLNARQRINMHATKNTKRQHRVRELNASIGYTHVSAAGRRLATDVIPIVSAAKTTRETWSASRKRFAIRSPPSGNRLHNASARVIYYINIHRQYTAARHTLLLSDVYATIPDRRTFLQIIVVRSYVSYTHTRTHISRKRRYRNNVIMSLFLLFSLFDAITVWAVISRDDAR